MGERRLHEPLDAGQPSGRPVRSNATSAESTFGCGRKTVRETGWKPVRRVASCISTETAPYAGARLGEEPVGDLELHHHAPASGRPAGRRGSRRRSGWRRCRAGSRRASWAPDRARPGRADRVADSDAHVLEAAQRVVEARLERAVELDRVHERDALREEARSGRRRRARSPGRRRRVRGRPAARSRRAGSGRRGSAGRGAASAAREAAHGRPNAARALAACARTELGRRPRRARLASAATVCTTFAGSLRRPRTGCGERYGLSVSTSRRSAGTARAAARGDRRRASVGDVAGEREVVAALERGREQLRLGEAVEDDGAVESRASDVGGVLGGLAAMDHDGQPRVRASASCASKSAAARPSRRVRRGGSRGPVSPTATTRSWREELARARRAASLGRRRPCAGGSRAPPRRRRAARRSRARRGTTRFRCRR